MAVIECRAMLNSGYSAASTVRSRVRALKSRACRYTGPAIALRTPPRSSHRGEDAPARAGVDPPRRELHPVIGSSPCRGARGAIQLMHPPTRRRCLVAWDCTPCAALPPPHRRGPPPPPPPPPSPPPAP